MDETLLLVVVGALVMVANLALVVVYARQYKRVPPGHAMVVFGRNYPGGKQLRVLTGGGRFIQPIIESYAVISLEPMTIELLLEDVVGSAAGPQDRTRRLHVTLTAIAKISDDVDRLKASAGHLIHKKPEEVRGIVEVVMEGHTRAVLSTEPSPETDIEGTSLKVRARTAQDLANLGIEVPSLFFKIREPGAHPGGDQGSAEHLDRELRQLAVRVRRIEEKLGVNVSGQRP